MRSFAIYTLGCKVNQLESEALTGAFRREGFAMMPWGAGADILLINTCTVTSRADQKARRVIRQALRDHPASCLIVTGCYAQLDAELLAGLERPGAGEKRLFVFPGKDKNALLDLPRYMGAKTGAPVRLLETWFQSFGNNPWCPGEGPEGSGDAEAGTAACLFRFVPEDFSFHSRAFLKIQDGCNSRCTFCRVSLARGPSTSVKAEQALDILRALEARGYGEAVLTGVNISQYRDGGRDIGDLLAYILEGTNRIALRLSSLEPEALTPKNLQVFAHPRVRPHFHLSIQSGSPEILRNMGRLYGPEELLRGAALLRTIKDDPFLACDLITGFPGEREGDFEKTRALCEEIGFAGIHAFPYSPRPGTAAWSFGSPVDPKTAARRVALLLDLARRGRRDYAKRWAGREVEVIVEEKSEKKTGQIPGISDNYLRVLIQKDPGRKIPPAGTALVCRLGELSGGGVCGDRGFDLSAKPRFFCPPAARNGLFFVQSGVY
jgi:threonylcarbamoyladenosine tRNA methylthiotransferase MtaB